MCGVMVWMPGAAQAEEEKPGLTQLTDLEQALDLIPREALVEMRGSKRDAGLEMAGEALQTNLTGKDAVLKIKVERYEKMPKRKADEDAKDPVVRYRLLADQERLKHGVTQFTSNVWINVDPDEAKKVPELRRGETVTVTGKVEMVKVAAGNPFRLLVTIGEARLK